MEKASCIEQLDRVLAQFASLKARSKYADSDMSDLPDSDLQRVITLGRAAIDRIAGPQACYAEQARDVLKQDIYDGERVIKLVGIVESLKLDVEAGYLNSLEELVHGDMFGDFLEMARYLLQENYKDAAAVIAGSTLESHLRQLCCKHGISTNNADGRPKKADLLNNELASCNAYAKLDQKSITAWLDLRNNAAHGHYGVYSCEQVTLMVDGVRDFITRWPA